MSVADCETLPAALEQTSVYVYVPGLAGDAATAPLADCAPAQAPLAVQPVVPTDDQVRTAPFPTATDAGETLRLTAAFTATLTD